MLVFLGLIAFVRVSYGEKLDQQSATRRDVLFYASHACEGGAPPGTNAGVDGATPDINAGAADKVGGKTREDSANALDRNWNMASASRDSNVYGTTVVDANARDQKGDSIRYEKVPLKRAIHAESHVACNEKRYDNPWTAWLSYGVDWAKSGGGIF